MEKQVLCQLGVGRSTAWQRVHLWQPQHQCRSHDSSGSSNSILSRCVRIMIWWGAIG